MKKMDTLLKKLSGMTAEQQAKAITEFAADERRRKTVEDSRKKTREKIFAGAKKLTRAQQESFIYEYLAANPTWMTSWLKKKHEDLYVDSSVINSA